MAPGVAYVAPDWYQTAEGREVVSSVINRNTQHRKPFGLLERPMLPPQYELEEYGYKVFISGKSGVGKTSLASRLSANSVPLHHSETPGIQTSVVYWPARILSHNTLVMFKLQMWDAGEHALKKFDHILPACKEHVDGVIFMFSFADKSSFEDLPQQMSRVLSQQDSTSKFVLGTKLDLHSQCEVTQRDITEFESHWRLPIFSLKTLPDAEHTDGWAELQEVAPLLNSLCDELWHRDQILTGNLAPTLGASGPGIQI